MSMIKMLNPLAAVWLCSVISLAAGCESETGTGGGGAGAAGGSGGEGGSGEGGAQAEQGTRMFVLSLNSGVASFSNAEEANGSVASKTLLNAGPDSGMYGPRDLELDAAGTLYVASENDGSVVMYEQAEQASGMVTPSRRLAGASTGVVAPIALAIDRSSDELYVVNSGSIGSVDTRIRVFAKGSTLDGEVAPARTIEPEVEGFAPIGLTFAGGALYAVTQTTNSTAVLVFEDVASADGLVAPSRTVTHPDFGSAAAVHVTAEGKLVVVDEAASVFVFNAGEAEPSLVFEIEGASALNAAHGLENGALLFSDRSQNRVFALDEGLPTAAGPIAPSRTIESEDILLPGALGSN
jgi:DNA-binding beta-propeller fold protein YncE